MTMRQWLNRLRYDSVRLLVLLAAVAAGLAVGWRWAENGRYRAEPFWGGRAILLTDTRTGTVVVCAGVGCRQLHPAERPEVEAAAESPASKQEPWFALPKIPMLAPQGMLRGFYWPRVPGDAWLLVAVSLAAVAVGLILAALRRAGFPRS
jgi:hypothetical protein